MKKTPIEKIETKINSLLKKDDKVLRVKNKVKVGSKVFLEITKETLKYNKWRYFPTKVESIVEVNYYIEIKINDENCLILSSNIINPPYNLDAFIETYNKLTKSEIRTLFLGSETNYVENNTLFLTTKLFNIINHIYSEEGADKQVRVKNRIIPFINNEFGHSIETLEGKIDYNLLLNEFLTNGEVHFTDIADIIDKIDLGDNNKVVIEKQLIKQTKWLVDSIQEIVDTIPLSRAKARELGHKLFGYSKISISGPENLMEQIFADYGKITIFGVPYLLRTKKYVLNSTGISRSQFDLIAINTLSDIQVIELKRPDQIILDFDSGRKKFYPSKDLSIAISQSERYISAVYHDNDTDYLIDGKKIRDYLNDLVGGVITIESCRPVALIVIGSFQTIAADYETLPDKVKKGMTISDYNRNYLMAYKEIKNAFKNIQIVTYSELLETARLRNIE
jgi:hypothetical protein